MAHRQGSLTKVHFLHHIMVASHHMELTEDRRKTPILLPKVNILPCKPNILLHKVVLGPHLPANSLPITKAASGACRDTSRLNKAASVAHIRQVKALARLR